jgi:hypothetical protein
MREAIVQGNGRVEVIDLALKNALGQKIVGASAGGGKMRAHLVGNSSIADENAARGVLEHYGSLAMTVDKTSIQANGTDIATISYAANGVVDWVAYVDGMEYSRGEETAVNGVVTLMLAVDDAGEYEVHVIERTGNCSSGSVMVLGV